METKKILITGATGNVGLEVLKALSQHTHGHEVLAGIRDVTDSQTVLAPFAVRPIHFDFLDAASADKAFTDCDILFLLRPPQLSDVPKYFTPLLEKAQARGIRHIVFLSVQGAENNSVIPHHKIEKLILASGIPYTFLRPAYFMQNVTTTFRKEILQEDRITVPAGRALFRLIDVEDVGKVAAKVLLEPARHQHAAYALTNEEALSFGQMAATLSRVLQRKISFNSPSLIAFYLRKRREQVPVPFILVMIMLHYLPRFQQTPPATDWVQTITGTPPRRFEAFAESNKQLLTPAQ
jgi:uncharacterized protein YbjT (DUF2867 family)